MLRNLGYATKRVPTKADKLAQRRVKISTIFKNVDFYDFKNVDFYDYAWGFRMGNSSSKKSFGYPLLT